MMELIRQIGIVVLITTSLIHQTNSFLCPNQKHSKAPLHLSSPKFDSIFLKQVEETIDVVNPDRITDIGDLRPQQRQSVAVAKNLNTRIKSLHRNNDCPTCWLQRAHCICPKTPPIESKLLPNNINRLFIIMHHKEICLAVDTAKLLLNSMPSISRLVVNGIGEDYQESMSEMMDVINNNIEKRGERRRCIVLFPTDDARTFEELCNESYDGVYNSYPTDEGGKENRIEDEKFDVIVIDGTWAQAQKIHSKYIPSEKDGGPARVCLSQDSLDILGGVMNDMVDGKYKSGGSGRQLRRHPIKWKEVSTLEATRLLLRDMMLVGDKNPGRRDGKTFYEILAEYQQISDKAAIDQLGPPRIR